MTVIQKENTNFKRHLTPPLALRHKAQSLLKKKMAKDNLGAADNETGRMFYDVQIRQFELEIQNEEL